MSLEVEVAHAQGGFRLRAGFRSAGGLTALFGRSGSGKTTLVNAIAGLVRPGQGRIVADGTVLVDTGAGVWVPAHRRRIGYVFQEGRLFPHLTVGQNLGYGRWFSRARRREGEVDPDAVVALLGLEALLGRRPGGLSGGERSRVAIGRALLSRPRLLLMDEPLASLDEARKAEVLPYLERLRDAVGVPIVYVSHSAAEVARLATGVVVLEAGRVVASGPPEEVLGAAAGDVERWRGAVLEARVEGYDEAAGLTLLATPAGPLRAPGPRLAPGARARVHVAAGDVLLGLNSLDGVGALAVLPGRVAEVAPPDPASPVAAVRVECGGASLVAELCRGAVDRLGLAHGRAVHVAIRAVSVRPGDGEARDGEPPCPS